MALQETRIITEMHPHHWHAVFVHRYTTDYGSGYEYDVDDYVCQYHAEALALHGRESAFGVYPCDDWDCLQRAFLDPEDEWWTPEACARRWGRND